MLPKKRNPSRPYFILLFSRSRVRALACLPLSASRITRRPHMLTRTRTATGAQEADSAAKRQHRDLQSQLHHSSGGGGVGGEGGGAGEEDGDEGEHCDVVVEVPLWRRCYRVTTGREGYYMWYGVLLMLQMVAIFGLFVSAAQDADSATQSVAGILGASSVVGLLVAIPAIYRRKPLFLNAYLVCQIWTCAMAAVFTADAIQDVFKSYNFCMLRGVGGVPDDGCATREIRARGKVFYSLCTALMTITVVGARGKVTGITGGFLHLYLRRRYPDEGSEPCFAVRSVLPA